MSYRGIIVCQLLATKSVEGEVTTSFDTQSFGQLVHNTKEHLGMSASARDLLATVKTSRDAIGDVMWFDTHDSKRTFGWIGGPYALKDPKQVEGDRDYKVTDDFVTIEDDVPQQAKDIIDRERNATS